MSGIALYGGITGNLTIGILHIAVATDTTDIKHAIIKVGNKISIAITSENSAAIAKDKNTTAKKKSITVVMIIFLRCFAEEKHLFSSTSISMPVHLKLRYAKYNKINGIKTAQKNKRYPIFANTEAGFAKPVIVTPKINKQYPTRGARIIKKTASVTVNIEDNLHFTLFILPHSPRVNGIIVGN